MDVVSGRYDVKGSTYDAALRWTFVTSIVVSMISLGLVCSVNFKTLPNIEAGIAKATSKCAAHDMVLHTVCPILNLRLDYEFFANSPMVLCNFLVLFTSSRRVWHRPNL